PRVRVSLCVFFFSSRRLHTRSKRDWSSDVCSSDLFEQIPISTIFDIVDYLSIPLDYVFNAIVLDGMNKYRFEQLNEELKNRTYIISEDFFTSYITEYVQKNLKEVDTPYISTTDLLNLMDIGVVEEEELEKDDLQNLIESLSSIEREKAYNILKQVFDE